MLMILVELLNTYIPKSSPSSCPSIMMTIADAGSYTYTYSNPNITGYRYHILQRQCWT